MKRLILVVFILSAISSSAQTSHYPFGFYRNTQIIASDMDYDLYKFAWLGGINSIRFFMVDINGDGFRDLLGFEKHGNKLIPFIYNPSSTSPYRYAPEYKHLFPKLHDWVIFKDYNNDGKEDIFTYGLGGIRVFKHTSSNPLQYTLVTEQLQSFYYNGDVNIFASPDDYIAIEDFDEDGDLDIVNFWILGKYVHFQKNLSMEWYGHADSLKFTLGDECWGGFSEAADNNIITLFTHCQTKEWDSDEFPTRHMGSSLQAYRNEDSTLFDIIIGDVDYPDLIYLVNGGSPDSALMVSQTNQFPIASDPVSLYSMPVLSIIDFNKDGKKEIIASPSDPSLLKSEDLNSVWMYQKDPSSGEYVLTTTSFMQENCIDVGSGAYPIFYDWEQDGFLDLFIANYGSYDSSRYVNGFLESHYSSSIAYFKNNGDTYGPKYHLMTTDFGSLKQYNYKALYPAFSDLDQNGTIDMLCGNSDGSLLFFSNQNPQGSQPNFNAPVSNYQNVNVSHFSTPQLFDIDQDGDLDLLVGNRRGHIAYYQNIGTLGAPLYQLVTSTLGNVDVRDPQTSYFGYSVPQFFRWNNQTFLVCGSEQGEIFLYHTIDGNLSGTFTRDYSLVETVANTPHFIDEGIRCGVAVAQLTNDQKLDMIVGNWAGGVAFFTGSDPLPVGINELNAMVDVYPNPAINHLNIHVQNGLKGIIRLYTGVGQLIKSIEIMESIHIVNISDLPSGLYVLEMESNGVKSAKKITVIR